MQQNSSLSTLLLILPMLAVPVLAITGIPQFSMTSQSKTAGDHEMGEMTSEDLEQLLNGENPGVSDAPPAQKKPDRNKPVVASTTAGQSDWGGLDITSTGANRTLAGAEPWGSPPAQSGEPDISGATQTGFTTPSTDQPDRSSSRGYHRQAPSTAPSVPARQPQSPPMTWQQAVHRLNELGVQNFRLEPSRIAGQYVFVCWYTPRETPQVSHQFRGESTEPLRAVQVSIEQIERKFPPAERTSSAQP